MTETSIRSAILVLYDEGRDEEKPPACVARSGFGISYRESTCVRFVPLANLPPAKSSGKDKIIGRDQWNNEKESVYEFVKGGQGSVSFRILAHSLREHCPGLAEAIDADRDVVSEVDYSTSELGLYSSMWKEIRDAADCDQLTRTLVHWIESYVVDPIRRIKHRSLNLLTPLDTDLQFLVELLHSQKESEFETLVRQLADQWQQRPRTKPISQLNRVWYMLVGDGLNWGRFDVLPPSDVSLPPSLKGEKLCLYGWLKYFGGEKQAETEEWKEVLRLAQLCARGSDNERIRFQAADGHGVRTFMSSLETRFSSDEPPSPRQNMRGFDKSDVSDESLESQLAYFHRWLMKFGEALEKLIPETK
jgi:hypothetical protein